MPGDPVLAMLGDKAPMGQIQEMRHQLGLDKPIYVQFFDYLFNLLRGDLGNSLIWGRRPIAVEILEHFPATLELTIGSMIIMLLVGVFTGAQSAYRRNSAADYGLRTYGIVIYSIPIFWFGMVLQLISWSLSEMAPHRGEDRPVPIASYDHRPLHNRQSPSWKYVGLRQRHTTLDPSGADVGLGPIRNLHQIDESQHA